MNVARIPIPNLQLLQKGPKMEHFSPKIVKAVETVKTSPSVQRAFDYVKEHLEETIRDQKELVLIEAPTGHEKAKAERYLSMLREAGLDDIYMDEHFNVIGKLHGTGNTGCSVLLEGHLDTVFSFGDVKGIETDAEGRIHCPGICDDTRAIAANLAVLRAFKAANLRPVHDIYFCGTVCEEGLGGMKGMAWTLDQLKDKTKLLATISIDGATAEIFYANATGMIDLEVTIEGPGGHAWTACERVSAIHAAGLAIAEIAKIVPPKDPKTTLTVSLIEGGQAIHAIAQKAVFKINARSNSQAALNEVEEQIYQAIRGGVEIEQEKEGSEGELSLSLSIEKTLDVPAGTQPDDAPIIQLAKLATQAVGRNYKFLPGGCTNTNMSIERGIPAVTLGRGGEEYGTHTLKEWFNPKGVYACEQKSILMLSVLAGLDGVIAPLDKA
jgi:tripeptide aminopeptidase